MAELRILDISGNMIICITTFFCVFTGEISWNSDFLHNHPIRRSSCLQSM